VTETTRNRLAYGLLVLTAIPIVGTFAASDSITIEVWLLAAIVVSAGLLLWSILGTLIVVRTRNRIGWIFLAVGLAASIAGFGDEYARASYRQDYVASLPLTGWAAWLAAGNGIAAMLLPLVFLLFPTGTPLPRWRWVARLWGAGVLLATAWLLRPGDIFGCSTPECPVRYVTINPLGVPMPSWLIAVLVNVGVAAIIAATVLAITSLFVRFRRASGLERQQLKWLLLIGVVIAVWFVLMILLQLTLPTEIANSIDWMWYVFILLIVVGIPVAAALAILRYRLYDIDVVISKTLVYAGLAFLIGAVYVGIVVGIGEAIGAGTQSPALQIAATALVALTFEPARSRLRRWANRVVYGKRAAPYEVMASFGQRVAEIPSADEVLGDMADAAREGLGALAATVSVRAAGGVRSVKRPDGGPVEGKAYEAVVAHAGETIGELRVWKAANEPLRPAERTLLDDLAGHAGLALHNVRLTLELEQRAEELAAQTEELRRSRERIVSARDAQRHRLERELRDGVGAELDAIRRDIEADAERVTTDPDGVAASLDGLGEEANRALEELRDVARGIFPPLLADKGLAAAVEAHVRKLGIDAVVEIDESLAATRLDPALENAAYFCLVQALQNASRHAPDTRVTVRMALDDGVLTLVVADGGAGFDVDAVIERDGIRIMRDRIAALGGDLSIESAPDRGTTVTAALDARPFEVVA
jgi:signal transduction histidine kinase